MIVTWVAPGDPLAWWPLVLFVALMVAAPVLFVVALVAPVFATRLEGQRHTIEQAKLTPAFTRPDLVSPPQWALGRVARVRACLRSVRYRTYLGTSSTEHMSG